MNIEPMIINLTPLAFPNDVEEKLASQFSAGQRQYLKNLGFGIMQDIVNADSTSPTFTTHHAMARGQLSIIQFLLGVGIEDSTKI